MAAERRELYMVVRTIEESCASVSLPSSRYRIRRERIIMTWVLSRMVIDVGMQKPTALPLSIPTVGVLTRRQIERGGSAPSHLLFSVSLVILCQSSFRRKNTAL
jgi:hypothetical protein